MSPVNPMLNRPPGHPLGTGVGAHCTGDSPLSHVYAKGIVVVVPFEASSGNGSLTSGNESPSVSVSRRSDTWLLFQSWGTEPAEQALVRLAISSALVKPAPSSSAVPEMPVHDGAVLSKSLGSKTRTAPDG